MEKELWVCLFVESSHIEVIFTGNFPQRKNDAEKQNIHDGFTVGYWTIIDITWMGKT